MRVKRGNVLRKRHKKILKLAKGFLGARSRIFKVANIAVMKKLKYQYIKMDLYLLQMKAVVAQGLFGTEAFYRVMCVENAALEKVLEMMK